MHEKQYELRYLPLFQQDLNQIVLYIARQLHNPDAAVKLVDDVEHAITERSFCAEAFEPYRSTKERANIYYRIYMRNYTIFYIVHDNVMEVYRILYNKRNTDRIL